MFRKIFTVPLLFLVLSCNHTLGYEGAKSLGLDFGSKEWGGSKMPLQHICTDRLGDGVSPSFEVWNIPKQANLIIVEFNKEDDPFLERDGGLGKIGYYHQEGEREALLLPVPGEKTRDLPSYAFKEASARPLRKQTNYAYQPPCSAGTYFAIVKAVHRTGQLDKQKTDVLAVGKIYLGKIDY